MSDTLDSEARSPRDEVSMTLAEAAASLGCHVETLRIRVRRGELPVRRGAHGRFYVTVADLDRLKRPRFARRRSFDQSALDESWRYLTPLLTKRAFSVRGLQFVAEVIARPELDRALFNHLGVYALLLAGLTTAESSDVLGISRRQVRRLRLRDPSLGVDRALVRRQRALHAAERRRARILVQEMQARLEAAGFQAARQDWWFSNPIAQARSAPRVALARHLDARTQARLREVGLSQDQVEAIRLVGIGSDELNELLRDGLPPSPE